MSAFHDNALMGASGQQGYKISRSVRLRSSASAYFNRTPASAGNRKTWTWSGWVKRGNLSNGYALIATTSGSAPRTLFVYDSDSLWLLDQPSGTNANLTSTAKFRDPSAWYHVILSVDTTQATSTNRVKMYVNGVEQTISGTYPTQNTDMEINRNVAHTIGSYSTNYFDGYLTEINFIDGQALTPSSFGETNAVTGVWQPKKYAGTYGTNGFYLNFSDNSAATAATIGKDYSGNGNNWTPNNISVTAGVTYDSMLDVPTPYADGGNGRGNYAVLNPLDQHGTSAYATVADGNLYWYGSYNTQNGHGIRSTLFVQPTGKWYVEASNVTYSGSGNSCMLGFTSSTQPITVTAFGGTLTPWIGVDASVFNNNIRFYSAGVSASLADGTTLFATCASGDVVSFAIDLSAGKIWVGKNGTWYNSGDPVAGTNATSTFTAGSAEWTFWAEYVAASTNTNRSSAVANFGQRPFTYTPTGFVALNTQNLPDATIKKGNQYFDVVTRTGTGTADGQSQVISSLAFTPDLVWNKARSNAFNHNLVDSARGNDAILFSNLTNAETSVGTTGTQLQITANGFTAIQRVSYQATNQNGVTYADWCWKESASAGFDIVTYTGNGSANRTVSHSLGVTPAMVIVKNRSSGTPNWRVWHQGLSGSTYYLGLNQTAAQATSSTVFNGFSSTTFTVGTDPSTNENASNFVAYCFAEVAGYSKFGSYTGNGSADGVFVYTGFRPKLVMFKRTDTTSNWLIIDSVRGTYNPDQNRLFPNLSNAEDTSENFDFLSNGFKLRDSAGSMNASGGTYIFMAVAENPFKLSLAR